MLCDWEGNITASLRESKQQHIGRVYGFGHMRADCRGPGSSPFEHENTFFDHKRQKLVVSILL